MPWAPASFDDDDSVLYVQSPPRQPPPEPQQAPQVATSILRTHLDLRKPPAIRRPLTAPSVPDDDADMPPSLTCSPDQNMEQQSPSPPHAPPSAPARTNIGALAWPCMDIESETLIAIGQATWR
eukprot:9494410-Pyramimonas_sp.AAC.1